MRRRDITLPSGLEGGTRLDVNNGGDALQIQAILRELFPPSVPLSELRDVLPTDLGAVPLSTNDARQAFIRLDYYPTDGRSTYAVIAFASIFEDGTRQRDVLLVTGEPDDVTYFELSELTPASSGILLVPDHVEAYTTNLMFDAFSALAADLLDRFIGV